MLKNKEKNKADKAVADESVVSIEDSTLGDGMASWWVGTDGCNVHTSPSMRHWGRS